MGARTGVGGTEQAARGEGKRLGQVALGRGG